MATPDSIEALNTVTKSPGGVLVCGVNFTRRLAEDETLDSCPTPEIDPDDDTLTIEDVAVNTVEFDDDSQPPIAVAIGKGVLLTVSGGVAPTAEEIAAGPPYTLPLIKIAGKVYRRYRLTFLSPTSEDPNVQDAVCDVLIP